MSDRIRYILIDIDDTLLDFSRCSDEAMLRAADECGLNFPDGYYTVFKSINDSLWRRIEKGEITTDDLYRIRWNLIFGEIGIDFDGVGFETVFRHRLNESAVPVEGARELLEKLCGRYSLFAASNAPSGQQEERLKKACLYSFFDGFFISDDIGASKPSKEYFDRCFEKLGNPLPDEVLLIGDSLTADINGAKAYGMPAILFDNKNRYSETTGNVLIVRSLGEITNIL